MAPSAKPVWKDTEPGFGSGSAPAKHRACDECRARKLACTKEADGCARCKREGIICHYSAQKPMGRPRKRPTIQSVNEPPAIPVTTQGDDVMIPSCTAQSGPMEDAGPIIIDQNPMIDPLLDTDVTDLSLLDLLGPHFVSNEPLEESRPPPADLSAQRAMWDFDISFDPHYPPPPSAGGNSTSVPSSIDTPSLSSQGATPPEPHPIDPALSSTYASTAATLPPSSDHSLQPPTCSCLANLYLALDSVSRLPTEIMPALRVARSAARAAHDTIQCQVCSPPLEKAMVAPLSTFQNMMIVGALIPSIADAYHRILTMVDAETTRAIATHTDLRFSLAEHGGMWAAFHETGCATADLYENQVMSPATWRLTVRALLKIDVYGVECKNTKPGGFEYRQMGLRDLVSQMDEKSIRRHADIDAMVEAGLAPPTGLCGRPAHYSVPRDGGGQEPQCRKIIAIARHAVEGLVIP
ncbi:hypothetical protein M406DRAFT_258882 [Cryphonectria parasitica EP155]|uniref:Zn(2)-C6 fungal-type domain-containing protein n=1 Tax=Cryphonectria parasitica (strain ATCC 38755 / EP155) TaxID=660469 RepID=A0A9P5CP61_CRYP1|nr:uncharacterized protein M406DRAFT_258882 [Cryphonectria parasitica EP155]KAF3764841.1 hypothetical protein M406DRAFT_258882 [Cryphonectria parasitica EP155]